MKIEIPDYLPSGLEPEFIMQDQVAGTLVEEGFATLARAFAERFFAYAKTERAPTWLLWEGYWKATGDTQTLLVFGVLYKRPRFFPRAIRVRNVKPADIEQTKDGLFKMIDAYLADLSAKLPGGHYGTGKTIGGWL
jgi:hypothetical protein